MLSPCGFLTLSILNWLCIILTQIVSGRTDLIIVFSLATLHRSKFNLLAQYLNEVVVYDLAIVHLISSQTRFPTKLDFLIPFLSLKKQNHVMILSQLCYRNPLIQCNKTQKAQLNGSIICSRKQQTQRQRLRSSAIIDVNRTIIVTEAMTLLWLRLAKMSKLS